MQTATALQPAEKGWKACIRKSITSVFLVMLLYSVTTHAPLAEGADKITYEDHLRPILADRCLSCHNPDKAKGGLDLSTYSSLMQGGSSGEIVNAGDPDSSRLFRSVAHLEEPFMPPKADKLTEPRLKVMRDWISGGLLENSGSKAKAGKPAFKMELAQPSTGKPEGPPPMPEHLVLAPAVTSQRPATPSDIASSPWAPLIALAVPKQVLLYNTDTLRLEGVLPFPEGTPSSLAFSRNGSILVAGGGRGGKAGLVVGWLIKTGERVFEIGSEFDAVLAADITADHQLIALGGPGRRIKIYSTSDGQEVANIKKHTDWVTSLAFSPDGILLATGDRNGGLYVWESETANPFYTLKAHSKSITSISWRADSNVVASASEDGSVRLWEMNQGKQVKNWNAHGGGVTDMAFSADGRIVTCGRDRNTKVWDSNGSQKSATKEFSDIPVSSCLSHDGNRFVAADWIGNVRVFNSADGKRIGDLVANPPAIDTRVAHAQSVIDKHKVELVQATEKHSGKLAEAKAAQDRLAGIRSQIAINTKQAESSRTAIAQAQAMISMGKEKHAAALKKQKADKEQAENIAAALKAAAEGAENRGQLEMDLQKARGMLEKQSQEIAAIQAEIQSAEKTLKAEQQALDSATTASSAASKELKPAEQLHATKTKEVSDSQSMLNGIELHLATARDDAQFWKAAIINVDRHSKQAIRPGLEAELTQLTIARKEAEESHRLSVDASLEAEKSIATAQNAEKASQNALNSAKARLPALEWERRLNETIAAQHKQAMNGIQQAMQDAPATMQPKVQAAIDNASKAIASADSETDRINGLIQNSVADAQATLDKVRSTVVDAQKALASRQAEQVKALAKLQEASKAHAASSEKIGQLDSEIAELQKRYSQALPTPDQVEK
jgi:WD40 repeat protein